MLTPDERQRESTEIQVLLAALDSYSDRLEKHHPLALDVVRRLAIAFWRDGDINRAISLLDPAVDQLATLNGPAHDRMRADLLDIVWKIMFEQGQLEQASLILCEVFECRVRHDGALHIASLETQGDLALVLFELGRLEEAELMGSEAFESARTHLGPRHSVTTVLAWNRMLNYERRMDAESARKLAVSELAWLLAEPPSSLTCDQREIQAWLAERWDWGSPRAC